MSKLLMPQHMRHAATADALKKTAVHRMDSDDFVSPADVAEQLVTLAKYVTDRREVEENYLLPQPSGWKLMVLVLTIPETTQGGLIVIDDSKEQKSLSSPQGIILAMGPAAYTDTDRFMVDGVLTPWHEAGDRISFVKYDATMFQLANGQRLGFLNDTQPLSKIDGGWPNWLEMTK